MSLKTIGILCVALILTSGVLFAADNDTQVVAYQVTAINEIAITGVPAKLVVNSATAGSQPDDSAADNSTSYAITTNGTSKKITGKIDTADMPTGIKLIINMTAPSVGAAVADVELTLAAKELVTGITQVAESGMAISYHLSATVLAAPVDLSKTVTFTITDA